MLISSEKYYFWSPECFCDRCQWRLCLRTEELGRSLSGQGCFCYSQERSGLPFLPTLSSRSQIKKTRQRDPPAGWFVWVFWAGQAEEAVLGHRVCTPHRWCFETVSASFLQPHLSVGIASCLKNVFPSRMCLVSPHHQGGTCGRTVNFSLVMWTRDGCSWKMGKVHFQRDSDWGL